MRALNVKIDNTQGQTKPVYDLYQNSLDNILDSNINNIVLKIVLIKLGPSQSISIMQSDTPQNVNVL